MALAVPREAARSRHHDYVLPNGARISLDTYLGKNMVTLASEGGAAPDPESSTQAYPMAYLVQQAPDTEIQAHYHQADQFQLFVQGSGRLGTHPLEGITVHYANALSPYGPIVSRERGLQYVTFRNAWDPGAQWMPAAAQRLRDTPGRKHLMLTSAIATEAAGDDGGPCMHEVIRDAASGLGVWLVRTGRDGVVRGPLPHEGGGQFWYSLEGEVELAGQRLERNSVVFTAPADKRVELRGMAEGATLVLMQFPRRGA